MFLIERQANKTICACGRKRGLATSLAKKPQLRKLLCIGRQKENAMGPTQDHMAADGGEGNQGDGEDLEKHQVYGKGPIDVEGACCCPTCRLGVKEMNE